MERLDQELAEALRDRTPESGPGRILILAGSERDAVGLQEVLARFDHTCINDVSPFDKINASSENMAMTIYQELSGRFPDGVLLENVQVWESPQSCITYSPE